MKYIILLLVLSLMVGTSMAGEAFFEIYPVYNSTITPIVPINRVNVGESFDIILQLDPSNNSIAGIQTSVMFNPSVIRVNEVIQGNLLSGNGSYGTFFFTQSINNSTGNIDNIVGVILGNHSVYTVGNFAIIRAVALNEGTSSLQFYNTIVASSASDIVPTTLNNATIVVYRLTDVNGDQVVDMLDLMVIAENFGKVTSQPYPAYDLNKDNIVNILDMVMVAKNIQIGGS